MGWVCGVGGGGGTKDIVGVVGAENVIRVIGKFYTHVGEG